MTDIDFTAGVLPVTIRPADPDSPSDLAQLEALQQACSKAAYGAIAPRSPEQRRVALESTPYWDVDTFVATTQMMEGGESIIGIAGVMLPLQENQNLVDTYVDVHPAFRGRGVATALVEEAVLPAFRSSDRSLITTWLSVPPEGDPNDPDLPANRLARRLGVERKSLAVCRALDLPLDPALLDELGEEAEEKIGDYRIETWMDRVPDEHLESYGRLLTQLELDDPDEDVEYDAAEYPPERIRALEDRRLRSGTRCLTAVAIAPDGTFAGNTEINAGEYKGTTLGFQENTLVMPEHRGHRLGLALKVANHRQLAREMPGLTRLITWNSHVNPWMIAINEKVGYRIISREIAMQGPGPQKG